MKLLTKNGKVLTKNGKLITIKPKQYKQMSTANGLTFMTVSGDTFMVS